MGKLDNLQNLRNNFFHFFFLFYLSARGKNRLCNLGNFLDTHVFQCSMEFSISAKLLMGYLIQGEPKEYVFRGTKKKRQTAFVQPQ